MLETRRKQLIEELGSRIDDHLAMLGVLNQATLKAIGTYAHLKATLPGRNKIGLLRLRDEVERRIKETARHYGFIGKVSDLRRIWADVQMQPDGSVLYMPKWVLQQYFTKYSRAVPVWDKQPAHGLILINNGQRPHGQSLTAR